MAADLELEVISPSRRVLKEPVEYVSVPSVDGIYGILPGHAPMVVALKPGVVHYRQAGQRQRLAIEGGFLEISDNQVILLADEALLPEEINVDLVREEAIAARKMLESDSGTREEREKARQRLQKSLTRLQVLDAKE